MELIGFLDVLALVLGCCSSSSVIIFWPKKSNSAMCKAKVID